jgi:NAD(P)H-dependent FMN reductase
MKLAVILGSARHGAGKRVAKWVTDTVDTDGRFELDFVDAVSLELPLFNEDFSPKYKHFQGKDYTNPKGKAWADRVAAADAFIFITPEYNHSISGLLKNTLDWVGPEWTGKPVGLVGYSGTPYGGIRAVEHLKQIAPELGLVQVNATVLVGAVPETITESGTTSSQTIQADLAKVLDEIHTLAGKLAA